MEFKLRPLIVPQDARLEVMVRVEPRDVPKSLSLTVLGHKSVTWTRSDAGLVREGATRRPSFLASGHSLTLSAADCGLQPGDRLDGRDACATGVASSIGMKCDWSGRRSPATDPLESLTAWRQAVGKSVPPELPRRVTPLVQGGPDKELSAEEAARLRTFYLAWIARPVTPELAAARQVWEAARDGANRGRRFRDRDLHLSRAGQAARHRS